MRSLLVLVVACGGRSDPEPKPAPLPPPAPVRADATLATPDAPPVDVSARWTTGCFTMMRGSQLFETDGPRCAQPRRPYSTFKLANALIAIDAGVLDGPDAEMTWDEKRVPVEKYWLDTWKQPKKSLRDAMKISSVPHFRTLALTLGNVRMRKGLAKLKYGNQDMGGGLDRFWLTNGALRIRAFEQLLLVKGIAYRTLDVSRAAQDAVSAITVLAEEPYPAAGSGAVRRVLHGKTGSGPIEDGKGGWLVWQVGWVEGDTEMIPYAAWLESHAEKLDDARAARDEALRATLDELGVFPRTL